MADDTVSPQQLIDDAAKALGETPVPITPNETPVIEKTEQLPAPVIPPMIAEEKVIPEPLPETPESPAIVPPMAPLPEPIPTPEETKDETVSENIITPAAVPMPPADITSPSLPPLPIPPEPEPMIIRAGAKDDEKNTKDDPTKPAKKKGGKGILIATLLFFILTLPVAIYYVTQSPQFAEIRSRAAQTACTKGAKSCKTLNGKNTGYQCTCFDPNTVGREQYSCKLNPTDCPTDTSGGTGGSTGGTGGSTGGGTVPDNTGSCNPLGRVMYTTGACASKGTYTGSWCPLDCGNLCCNRLDSVCCCMGCYPKGTDCTKAPYNCESVSGGGGGGGGTTTGCPQSTCYTGYPTTAVPHENCLVCSPDRSKLNTVTFTTDGTVRIHMEGADANSTVTLTKNGSAATVTRVSDGNFNANITAGTYTIAVKLGSESANAVGFIRPTSDNKCGRYPSASRDISAYMTTSALSNSGITTTTGVDIPYQCWADAIQGEDTDQRGQLDANWDFEDFNVIIGYVATATPTPSASPAPGICDASCSADSNCESGLSCQTVTGVKRCRKSACPDKTDCSCPEATATPTPRPTSPPVAYNTPTPTIHKTPTPTTVRLIAAVTETPTPTDQPTPKIPVAGVGPGIVGAISVAGSILLLILGLVL